MNPFTSFVNSLKPKTPTYSSMQTVKPQMTSLKTSNPSAATPFTNPVQAPQTKAPVYPTPNQQKPAQPTQTVQKSPAMTSYVNSIAPQNNSSVGLSPDQQTELERIKSSAGNPQSSGTTAPSTAPAYLDAYRNYLSQYADSLKPSDEIMAANQKLAESNSQIDERSLKARREYEAALDKSGGLLGGNQQSADMSRRRNTSELADLGVIQSAAARNVDALTGARTANSEYLKTAADLAKPIQVGDSYIDPKTGQVIPNTESKAGFELGQGQSRYEYNPTTGKYESVASVAPKAEAGTGTGATGTYTAGANSAVDSYANLVQNGSYKLENVPANIRNSVASALNAMGNSPDGKPTTTELGKAALTSASSLLKKFDAGTGTSAVGKSGALNSLGYGFIPGTDRANFVADFNALKSQLALEGVKYLKGQGSVSDSERELLKQATTKLTLTQSEAEFKKTLEDIITKLEGGSQDDIDEEEELRLAGYSPEQIAALKSQ